VGTLSEGTFGQLTLQFLHGLEFFDGALRSAQIRRVGVCVLMAVSRFEISCDFLTCESTIAHGPAGPRLTAGAFQEAVDLLMVAHRWTVDEEGRDLCALHSQSSDRVQKKGTVKYVLPSTT
jgi:hypothetical protein